MDWNHGKIKVITNIVNCYVKKIRFPISLNFHRYAHLRWYSDGEVTIEILFSPLPQLGISSSSPSCYLDLPATSQSSSPALMPRQAGQSTMAGWKHQWKSWTKRQVGRVTSWDALSPLLLPIWTLTGPLSGSLTFIPMLLKVWSSLDRLHQDHQGKLIKNVGLCTMPAESESAKLGAWGLRKFFRLAACLYGILIILFFE